MGNVRRAQATDKSESTGLLHLDTRKSSQLTKLRFLTTVVGLLVILARQRKLIEVLSNLKTALFKQDNQKTALDHPQVCQYQFIPLDLTGFT